MLNWELRKKDSLGTVPAAPFLATKEQIPSSAGIGEEVKNKGCKIKKIKKFVFSKNIGYPIVSIPIAPLLQSKRNSMGFCFYRGFTHEIR